MDNKESKLITKEEDGKKVSPVLPLHIRNYLVDVDGTVCEDIPNEEPERMARPKCFPALYILLTSGMKKDILLHFLLRAPRRIAR